MPQRRANPFGHFISQCRVRLAAWLHGSLVAFGGVMTWRQTHMGGTMRLGARKTIMRRLDCQACALYGGAPEFDERHRHRYEVNVVYVPSMEANGLEFVGRDTTGERMEVLELAKHPFFLAAQYHPEFKSRPLKPSPLFYGLVCASAGVKAEYTPGSQSP